MDKALKVWYLRIHSLGREDAPVTLAGLGAKAGEIADEPGVTGFMTSMGLIQKWAQRHKLGNVALWGQG